MSATTAAEIATAFRLKRDGGTWRGDCPACGYAGTFSTRSGEDGGALWYCHSCQDVRGIGAAIRGVFGGNWTPPAPRGPAAWTDATAQAERAKKKARALALWECGEPFDGTFADRYLTARGLPGVQSSALRFHPAIWCAEAERKLPAMLAAVTMPDTGEMIALHRTYLAEDGQGKAPLQTPKKTLGSMAGGVIALDPPVTGEPLVIAEGIETALSAVRMIGRGFPWAAIAAGNLSRLALPAGVAEIIISADPDMPGQREAWAAAKRWQAEGRRVLVATPKGGGDANDALRRKLAEAPSG